MLRPIRFFVASVLLCIGSSAHAAWHQAKSKHFIIYSNESAADLRAYAERLERFDQAVRYIRKMDDPALTDSGRVTIFVVNNASAIEKLAGFGGVRGMYRTTSGGSYAFVPRRSGMSVVKGMNDGPSDQKELLTGEHVFFHEYAHHLQLQHWAGVMPAWVSEGFAEFFATAEIDSKGNVTIGKFPPYRSWEVFLGGGLSAEDMVGADFHKLNWYEGVALYGRAWLLTHYLSLSGTRRGQLSKYLTSLEKGTPAADAGKAAFGDLKALSREIDAYAAPRNFMAFTVAANVLAPQQVAIRPLTAGEAAVMPMLIRSKFGVVAGSGKAKEIASQARSAAANFPNDPRAQSALAEAEYDAKNYAAAEAAADRALAADPKSVHALIYKGRAQMALAKDAGGQANWDGIRSWFLKANKLDTENAEPLSLYFQSFKDAGQPPSKNAVDGLLYAVELAPQDEDVRLHAVNQLLADHKLSDAMAIFAPIAFEPHKTKEWRQEAPKIIKAMESGRRDEALALLEKARQRTEKNKRS